VFARLTDLSFNEQVEAQINDSDFEAEAELPSLSSFISKDVLRRLKDDEKKWQEVVNGKHCVVVVLNINIMISVEAE